MADQKTESWAVTVERNGERVVTLASNDMGGRELSCEDELVIQTAATHLLSFIGHVPESISQGVDGICRASEREDSDGLMECIHSLITAVRAHTLPDLIEWVTEQLHTYQHSERHQAYREVLKRIGGTGDAGTPATHFCAFCHHRWEGTGGVEHCGDCHRKFLALKADAKHPRWKSTMGRLYAQWLACLMQLREFEFHTKAFRTESARQIDEEVRAALAPDAPAALLTEDDCDRLAKDPATQRLYDLVRYSRGYLSDEGLITHQEYAYLVSTGSSSARRLETYDQIKGRA